MIRLIKRLFCKCKHFDLDLRGYKVCVNCRRRFKLTEEEKDEIKKAFLDFGKAK